MIRSIYIKNYGIIQETEFHLNAGFNVITGETGAGKSMIVGAISLLMGARYSGISRPFPQEKSILELILNLPLNTVEGFFKEHDIDLEFPVILRRELNSKGRSRTFINDSPVSIQVLNTFAQQYISLSQQHENLSVAQQHFSFDFVDSYAGNASILNRYQQLYKEKKQLEEEVQEIKSRLSQQQAERDYVQFQRDELEALNMTRGEKLALEEELEVLAHAEEVKQSLYQVYQGIDGQENALSSQLDELLSSLRKAAQHHKPTAALLDRMSELSYELRDVGNELEREFELIQDDPKRLESVESRLSEIYRLMQKHALQEADDLVDLAEKLQVKLDSDEELQNRLNIVEQDLVRIHKQFDQCAHELSQSRQKVLKKLASEMEQRLRQLSMPDAQFILEMEKAEKCHFWGNDDIRILFSANKGLPAQKLQQVASGGELSRLMLSIKSLMGMKKKLHTLIFDEIDTGISGETASQVGLLMKDLAKSAQLLVISHLPQIAACAEQHFIVEKDQEGTKASSHLRLVSGDERIQILATMLSGDRDSLNARKTAKEMLKQ
jgi:DNA repair protein RecN (Recombination protein N)